MKITIMGTMKENGARYISETSRRVAGSGYWTVYFSTQQHVYNVRVFQMKSSFCLVSYFSAPQIYCFYVQSLVFFFFILILYLSVTLIVRFFTGLRKKKIMRKLFDPNEKRKLILFMETVWDRLIVMASSLWSGFLIACSFVSR